MAAFWFAFVLLALVMYVVLDGYDLGIGVATLFERDAQHRREMLEQVAQAWDGNESWLVLAVVSLWAGFPLAFGTILPHAYLALVVVLLSLIVRGVSVEMASQTYPAPRWERAFGIGSLVAAIAQGVVVSTLAARVTITGGAFSGSAFGSFGWFSALTALTVTCVYLSLGYAYMKWKATGELRVRVGRRGAKSAAVATVLIVACLVASQGGAASLTLRGAGRAVAFAVLLLLAAAGLALTLITMRPTSRHDVLPLVGLLCTTVAVIFAVVVARYPVLVPGAPSVTDAASPRATMLFLAIGIGINVPFIFFYTWFGHHAFRGKVYGPGARLPRSD
jgi:cytochrome d ubiquinol oxidase subunit II